MIASRIRREGYGSSMHPATVGQVTRVSPSRATDWARARSTPAAAEAGRVALPSPPGGVRQVVGDADDPDLVG